MKFFSRRKKLGQDGGEFDTLVRLGNAANADKRWREASDHYSKALQLRPADVAIRIQLGHCLKEQGQLADAEQAYRRATLDNALDADAYLHLGHVLKMLEKKQLAVSAYHHAARLGTDGAVGRDARQELFALGCNVPPAIVVDFSGINHAKYSDLVANLKYRRWGMALAAVEVADEKNWPLKLIKAQLYQILQRDDEALSLYSEIAAYDPKGLASKAMRSLYIERGRFDEASNSLTRDLENAVKQAKPFEAQAALVGEMVSIGKISEAFEICSCLFSTTDVDKSALARAAVDVTRRRVGMMLPPILSDQLNREFLNRSADLRQAGQHPQARLLGDAAAALSRSRSAK
ncbi:tetratricopeptide repeat protein [Rhizobium sp. LjRoot98]|uniref:tetratricopeptide repeat protein n=1 Tax=Rhizobium sp. LjRoot98 TaxID=3342345 RepID=UPI003ECFF231